MLFQNIVADIYLLILLLCSGISLWLSYKKNFPPHLKSFAWLNLVTFLVETWAYLSGLYFHSNWKIYNCFVLIETTWHAYFFYQIITIRNIRKWIPWSMGIYFLFWLGTNIFVIRFFSKQDVLWNSYTIIAASLLTVLLSATYIFQLIEIDNVQSLRKKPEFWIVCALLVFYTCQIPYFGAFNFMIKYKLSIKQIGFGNLRTLMNVLNDIMYATFIYAYLCQLSLMKYKYRTT